METLRGIIRLLPTVAGGRRTAIALDGRYRPHLSLDDGTLLGVRIRSDESAELQPGAQGIVLLDLPYEIDYGALVEGTPFSIMEGPRAVGNGWIVEAVAGS
jgi:translation elongation factor EF-Tu-like GTPase